MAKVEVFDPPMCCSTGVCGPSVDPALARFAANLRWIEKQGAGVTRYNLAQEPGPFASHAGVRALLAEGGDDVLPVVVVDGEVRSSGRYPAKTELAAWVFPGAEAEALDEVTAELVAIGAAVGANCEPCFKYHYGKARAAGASTGVITAAVRLAQTVKDAPARSMLDLAARLLGTSPLAPQAGPPGTEPGQAAQATADSAAGAASGAWRDTAAQLLPLAEQAPASSACCGGTSEAAECSPAPPAAGSGACGG